MSVMQVEATKNPAVSDAERAVVKRLAQAWIEWQKEAPVGVDYGIGRMASLLAVIDKEAQSLEAAGTPEAEVFASAVKSMHAFMDRPSKSKATTKQMNTRRRLEGGKAKSESHDAYHLKTVELLAADFPAWLEEVSLGGFFKSLVEFFTIFDEVFHSVMDNPAVPEDSKLFMVSFDLRQRLGKIPTEMLQALELLTTLDNESKTEPKTKAKASPRVRA